MAGFNTEVKKRVAGLRTGIHLCSIVDASIVKGTDGKPLLSPSGDLSINITFANHENKKISQAYFTSGSKEYFFKKMCSDATINLEEVKKTGKFKAEALGKRIWVYVKEVYDIDGETLILDDIDQTPVINYYVFKTSYCGNPEHRPSVKGDPEHNGGIATDEFVDYRQVKSTPLKAKPTEHSVKDDDDFPDIEDVKPKVQENTLKVEIKGGTAGALKGNAAFLNTYNKLQENNNFLNEKTEEKVIEPMSNEEIDFDNF